MWLRESNQYAYTSKMVSIGPYHKRNPQLRLMEKYKLLYLQRFLQRKEGLDVQRCITVLEDMKEEALKYYDNNIEDLDIHEFCKMLLLDDCFVVFDYTETFLRNLIAYEQQSSDVQPKYVSDFVIFMYQLIDSDKDVNLLCQKGIIKNWMKEDKEVAYLFNRIGDGFSVYSTFYYNEECLKATQYCEKPWNKMRTYVMHNYFNKPWQGLQHWQPSYSSYSQLYKLL
ncbi:hypothetical protein MTR67_016572 [Solanum verrucosum]|uniref:Uncharacterized protein n=1 Tax=Solanum verrucosum TaxID=315347 RepID=A0AAF0QG92_SOLVR|nr:hypothetical protein MTR67_016572 [Solanum verrucosum]